MSKLHPTTYFISLLLFILVLRQAHLSPLTLLLSPISRLTQEQKLSERFCTNPQPTFSSDEESRAESYRSSLSSLRDDNTLTSFIERGEPKDTFAENYGKSFIPYLVPWVVFFGLGILSCLIYLINWCCMNCSCLKNRACGCCKAPKSPRFKNCYVILSVLFMIFTIGAGVTGIVFVSGIPKYSDATMCSVVKFIEQVQDGSEDDKWIGIGPAINKIDDLVSKVNDAVSGLSVYDSLLADFNQNLDDVSNSVDSLYTDNQGSTLDRINPDEGIYTPYYIQELGPSTTDGTITNLIQDELDKSRQSLNDNQATLDSFKNDVKSSTDQVLNDVLANRPTLVQTNTWLTNALDDISNNQSTIDQVIGIISGLLLGLVIANVSVGGIAIISILLVCCGAKLFNKSIHLSWCILGLLMIIGWAISTVLFAGTIIVSEACDVGTGALQNPEFFNKTFDNLGTTFNWKSNDFNRTRNIIYRCVHGDGDLAQEFNLTSNLVFFNDIFTNINQISSDTTESLNALPESLSSSQDTVLSQFKEGLIPDSNETIIDLIALNMLTNSSENPCTTIDDRWYLNSQNCTVNEGAIFQATSSADFNVPDATCIGYNNWNASQRSIGDRYTQSQFSGLECGSSNNDAFVISYIDSLARNRQQSNTLIDTLQTSVNNLEDKYTNFKVSLQRTPQTLEDTNTTVADIYNTLTDKDTGLIANTNCKFIAEAIEELRDVTCTGLGATVYQTTIAFLVLSFVTLFGTMFLFCLAKRFTVQNENGKLSPESYVVK